MDKEPFIQINTIFKSLKNEDKRIVIKSLFESLNNEDKRIVIKSFIDTYFCTDILDNTKIENVNKSAAAPELVVEAPAAEDSPKLVVEATKVDKYLADDHFYYFEMYIIIFLKFISIKGYEKTEKFVNSVKTTHANVTDLQLDQNLKLQSLQTSIKQKLTSKLMDSLKSLPKDTQFQSIQQLFSDYIDMYTIILYFNDIEEVTTKYFKDLEKTVTQEQKTIPKEIIDDFREIFKSDLRKQFINILKTAELVDGAAAPAAAPVAAPAAEINNSDLHQSGGFRQRYEEIIHKFNTNNKQIDAEDHQKIMQLIQKQEDNNTYINSIYNSNNDNDYQQLKKKNDRYEHFMNQLLNSMDNHITK